MWPLSRFERPVPSGPIAQAPAGDGGSPDEHDAGRGRQASSRHGLARRTAWAALADSGAEHFARRLGVSAELAAWIRGVRPEVLYTHLESLPMIGFVESLVTRFDLPLVIHMMDDWPSAPENEGLLGPVTRRVIDRDLRRLIGKASGLMAISPYMCDAFQARYGGEWQPFANVLDAATWNVVPRSDWQAAAPFRIVYTGRVGKANQTSLRDLARVVASLAAGGRSIRLEIYALEREPFTTDTWPDSPAVEILPPKPYADIPGLLVGADLLVLPLDFSEKDLAFARFSMPTKVAEYLGSGTPILAYCPAESAVGAYARAVGWGRLVGVRDLDALTCAVVELADDEQERRRLGSIALEVARRDHDPARIRSDFARALLAASRRRSRSWP